MSYFIVEGREKLEKFKKFLEEEEYVDVFHRQLEEKMRSDVASNQGRLFGTLGQMFRGPQTGWIAILISAFINKAPVAVSLYETEKDIFGVTSKDSESDDMGDDIKVSFKYKAAGEFNTSFGMDISLNAKDDKAQDLLNKAVNTLHYGGEIKDEDGEVYTFEAQRSHNVTEDLEKTIADALGTYFAERTEVIDRELNQNFQQYLEKEKRIKNG